MALDVCGECKNQISSKAKQCIHCGALIKPKLGEALLGLLFLALVVGGVVKCVASIPESMAEDRRRQECGNGGRSSAYFYAERFITERLRAPSTAVYPSFNTRGVNVEWQSGCKFRVLGFVDAQNGFGALIRSTYFITVQYDPEKDRWYGSEVLISGS